MDGTGGGPAQLPARGARVTTSGARHTHDNQRDTGTRGTQGCSAGTRLWRARASCGAASHVPIRYNGAGVRKSCASAPTDRGGANTMPTYIMLSSLTPEGVQTVKNNPQRIKEVNKEVEQLGATVKAQWATRGHVDFVSVVEAPDEKTIARVSLELGSRGTGRD